MYVRVVVAPVVLHTLVAAALTYRASDVGASRSKPERAQANRAASDGLTALELGSLLFARPISQLCKRERVRERTREPFLPRLTETAQHPGHLEGQRYMSNQRFIFLSAADATDQHSAGHSHGCISLFHDAGGYHTTASRLTEPSILTTSLQHIRLETRCLKPRAYIGPGAPGAAIEERITYDVILMSYSGRLEHIAAGHTYIIDSSGRCG